LGVPREHQVSEQAVNGRKIEVPLRWFFTREELGLVPYPTFKRGGEGVYFLTSTVFYPLKHPVSSHQKHTVGNHNYLHFNLT